MVWVFSVGLSLCIFKVGLELWGHTLGTVWKEQKEWDGPAGAWLAWKTCRSEEQEPKEWAATVASPWDGSMLDCVTGPLVFCPPCGTTIIAPPH